MDGMRHDIEIIRPAMRDAEVRMRAGSAPPADLRLIRKGLLTLHTLELMAVNIYRCQIIIALDRISTVRSSPPCATR